MYCCYQCPIKITTMLSGPKLLLNHFHEISNSELWNLSSPLLDKFHNFLAELVPPLRASLLANQPCQALPSKVLLGFVEGRSREAEARSRLADLSAFPANPTQHFVFDLS